MNVATGSTTLASKMGNDSVTIHQPRISFLGNAGVVISDVNPEDAGRYQSTVMFGGGKSIMSEAILNVEEGKIIVLYCITSFRCSIC